MERFAQRFGRGAAGIVRTKGTQGTKGTKGAPHRSKALVRHLKFDRFALAKH